jgi:hypothetical protein
MSATLDDALEALRRIDFYAQMAAAERELRENPAQWDAFVAERDAWLSPDIPGR